MKSQKIKLEKKFLKIESKILKIEKNKFYSGDLGLIDRNDDIYFYGGKMKY